MWYNNIILSYPLYGVYCSKDCNLLDYLPENLPDTGYSIWGFSNRARSRIMQESIARIPTKYEMVYSPRCRCQSHTSNANWCFWVVALQYNARNLSKDLDNILLWTIFEDNIKTNKNLEKNVRLDSLLKFLLGLLFSVAEQLNTQPCVYVLFVCVQ